MELYSPFESRGGVFMSQAIPLAKLTLAPVFSERLIKLLMPTLSLSFNWALMLALKFKRLKS